MTLTGIPAFGSEGPQSRKLETNNKMWEKPMFYTPER